MAHFEIDFVRRQTTTRVIEADTEEEALRIGYELLGSDFYLVIDEEMMEVFEPDTDVEVLALVDGYEIDDGYMSKEEIAEYIGEE